MLRESLPAPMKIVQNVTIGPSLGQDSINKGVRAALIGGLIVVVFMVLAFRAFTAQLAVPGSPAVAADPVRQHATAG